MRGLERLERPPSLYRTVQASIRDYIVENGLTAGEPLPAESELARSLGVSRNSVREAIKALETTGLVESRRGAGVFVGAFSFDPLLDVLPYGLMQDPHELQELLEVRQALESGLIDKAIRNADDVQLGELRAVLTQMEQRSSRGESFPEEDRSFHALLFSRCGNRMLLRLLDIFWLAFNKASKHIDLEDKNPARTYQDHADIVLAIGDGDVEAARSALVDRHYAGIARRLELAQESTRLERQ